jgi:hypothetical protein
MNIYMFTYFAHVLVLIHLHVHEGPITNNVLIATFFVGQVTNKSICIFILYNRYVCTCAYSIFLFFKVSSIDRTLN